MSDLFHGFETRTLICDRGEIFARVGGAGPPLLLLHGYPQTHLMWHAAAQLLAEHFTVVATDVSGYGASFRPRRSDDHSAHSKRAFALDQVQAMSYLGFDRFAVAGHDRGGRVAYRMALDHPDVVEALAVLDMTPTAEVWDRINAKMAVGYWHWSFLAQPSPLPERLIGAEPDLYFKVHMGQLGMKYDDPTHYPAEAVAAYQAQFRDPGTLEAMCEDYRAGATIDWETEIEDRNAGNVIECPVLLMWGLRGALERFYGEPVQALVADRAESDGTGHRRRPLHRGRPSRRRGKRPG